MKSMNKPLATLAVASLLAVSVSAQAGVKSQGKSENILSPKQTVELGGFARVYDNICVGDKNNHEAYSEEPESFCRGFKGWRGRGYYNDWHKKDFANNGFGSPNERSRFGFGRNVNPVPEAGEWVLMLSGLALMGYMVRRRTRTA